jgi:hypothetical protein
MIERPLQSEFSRFIPDRALHEGYQGYHLTMVYKNAQTPRAADWALKGAIPKILSQVVGHWFRAAGKGNLVGIGFLDTPGSRGASQRALAPANPQDDYHHHCILLVKPSWARKIDRFTSTPSIEIEDDPSHSPFRRKMARSSARLLRRVRGMLVEDDIIRHTPVRSLMIQRLPDEDDIERATNYAAKSVDRLSRHFPDEAYSVLTKLREDPRKRIAR